MKTGILLFTILLSLVVAQPVSALQMMQKKARPVVSQVRISPNVKASVEAPRAKLRSSAVRGLGKAGKDRLGRVIGHLKAGNQTAAKREWHALIEQAHAGKSGKTLDTDAMIQYVLRESYVEQNKDLQFYADKVRSSSEQTRVGDNAQRANIDLQNQLQKQQQTLQTMSNVSKMMHDTAMAIIRKIG